MVTYNRPLNKKEFAKLIESLEGELGDESICFKPNCPHHPTSALYFFSKATGSTIAPEYTKYSCDMH